MEQLLDFGFKVSNMNFGDYAASTIVLLVPMRLAAHSLVPHHAKLWMNQIVWNALFYIECPCVAMQLSADWASSRI
jgi:hypothetical protein